MSDLFPGPDSMHLQSIKQIHPCQAVSLDQPGNINPVPIRYDSHPRVRGRLTLRRLALRRNPWTFGESVSHTLCRYLCQHSHFRYLQNTSPCSFISLRNAPLPLIYNPITYKPVASVCSFSPVTSSAQKNLDLDQ